MKTGYKNYDPEVHEEYLIHDTPIPLPHHLQPCAAYSIAINTANRLKCNNFLLWLTFFLKNQNLKFGLF